MAKATALSLAMGQLVNATRVDVRRRNGEWVCDPIIDQPPISAGKCALIPTEDIELILRRLQAVEHAQLLAKAQKKAAGIRTTHRR